MQSQFQLTTELQYTKPPFKSVSSAEANVKNVIFQIVGEMFAGDSFGELALLHDIKRAATIICKGTAEFLTVDKPDFDMVHTY